MSPLSACEAYDATEIGYGRTDYGTYLSFSANNINPVRLQNCLSTDSTP
jgi:hypothetical protein